MSAITLNARDALVVTDVQNDFLPGGSLAVRRSDEIIPTLNRYIALFATHSLPVFATRDWHPPKHCSFVTQGGIWPVHRVAGTPGAAFSDALLLPDDVTIVSKATVQGREAYSAFQGTDLGEQLRKRGIQRLFVGGLTTDYCVLNTVRDALANGFEVAFLEDGIRAVDVHPGDGQAAIEDMLGRGAKSVSLVDVARQRDR